MRKKLNIIMPITITFVLLGILLSTQLQTQDRLNNDLSAQNVGDLTIMVNNLSEKRRSLTQEVTEAKTTYDTYLQTKNDESAIIRKVQSDLDRMNLSLGYQAVQGPGVSLVITNDMHMIYKDVIDIVNELWAAGANAISLNDKRINNNSAIYYTQKLDEGYLITLDGNILAYPITIRAIGKTQNLEKGLTMPGGIIDNLAVFMSDTPDVLIHDAITIPAAEERPVMKYATPASKTS